MIIFSSVTKTFGNGTTALDNISLRVEPGELVVITGPSGSGKTTLMRLLIREYDTTSGEISFYDLSLKKIKNKQIPHHRRQIGVVFQDYKLLPDLNVWENIALPLNIVGRKQSEIESRVTDLLKLIGLEDNAWLFPAQLSGGEAQRVSIARALATGPDVIFADEPTGNLDKDTSLAITKLLTKINELGTTVLIATHDTSVLNALEKSRQIHLDKGKLDKDTHPKEIIVEIVEKLDEEKGKKSKKKIEVEAESLDEKKKTKIKTKEKVEYLNDKEDKGDEKAKKKKKK